MPSISEHSFLATCGYRHLGDQVVDTSATLLVHESIDLDRGETNFEMFGRRHNSMIKLSNVEFPDAFKAFTKLIPRVGKPCN